MSRTWWQRTVDKAGAGASRAVAGKNVGERKSREKLAGYKWLVSIGLLQR